MDSVKTYFEDIAEDWATNHSEKSIRFLQRIFRERLPALHGPVLDTGSGTGILIPFLSAKIEDKKRIVEYDIAFNMLKKAKEHHASYGHVFYTQGDGHTPGFKDNSFATIFCFRFIPHLENKKKAMKEFYRILLPGGNFFILHFMDHHALNRLHQEADAPIRSHKMPPVTELSQTLGKAGFHVEEYEEKEDLYFVRAIKPR